ncbi:hypothetical protein RHSIM_RhsimUnG0129300 [Rhododendron simsii]|uniref:Uncharacterized protein n=1 Tax=Rhododendron simsii TaxID=118357 RepID=A0A834FW13_RHOSS|nr:hypothetical protein RHSIM_RhsimUnG0129300 [Rhododendron simsii]
MGTSIGRTLIVDRACLHHLVILIVLQFLLPHGKCTVAFAVAWSSPKIKFLKGKSYHWLIEGISLPLSPTAYNLHFRETERVSEDGEGGHNGNGDDNHDGNKDGDEEGKGSGLGLLLCVSFVRHSEKEGDEEKQDLRQVRRRLGLDAFMVTPEFSELRPKTVAVPSRSTHLGDGFEAEEKGCSTISELADIRKEEVLDSKPTSSLDLALDALKSMYIGIECAYSSFIIILTGVYDIGAASTQDPISTILLKNPTCGSRRTHNGGKTCKLMLFLMQGQRQFGIVGLNFLVSPSSNSSPPREDPPTALLQSAIDKVSFF